jgi:Glycosyl transferases group 1
MNLLALAGDIDALIAQIRLVTPLTALCQRHGWTLTLKSFHDCAGDDVRQAQVLVVQRASTARVWRLQQMMQRQGGAVIYDIDDLLTDVAPHISNQAAVRQRVPMLLRCMHTADVVSVSTARLGLELGLELGQEFRSQLALHAAVEVPNFAWEAAKLKPPTPQPGLPVTLLFASSDQLATHFMYPALRALEGVKIVVVVPPAEVLAQAAPHVDAQPLMPREAFVAFARSLPNVLAVIPLEASRFAACKSAVKWFDYAAAGVPTLCSAVSPYAEVILDDVTGGLVPNEPEAWRSALCRAVADDAWRARIARAAHAQVLAHHSLAITLQAWEVAVSQALERSANRPAMPTGAWQGLRERWWSQADGVALWLRTLNRARLAKRSRR